MNIDPLQGAKRAVAKAVRLARVSPTITHAQARMLSKAGWQVHVTDSYGRKYDASGLDEILSFERKPPIRL